MLYFLKTYKQTLQPLPSFSPWRLLNFKDKISEASIVSYSQVKKESILIYLWYFIDIYNIKYLKYLEKNLYVD